MRIEQTRVLKASSGAFEGVTDFVVQGDTIVTISERSNSIHVVEAAWEGSSSYFYRGEQSFSGVRASDVDLQALRVIGDDVTVMITQASDVILSLSWDNSTQARPEWTRLPSVNSDSEAGRSFDPLGQSYIAATDQGGLRWVGAYTGQQITIPEARIDLSGFLVAEVLGRRFAFGYSESDGAIVSYFIGPNGVIRARDVLDTDDAFFGGRPHALEIAHFEDRSILIIADSQTGAISTVKVNEWGGMFYMHDLYDSRDTRFADITAMDYTTVGGRHFIVAGGSDDGVSILELTPDGMLHVHMSIADSTTTTLNNVSAVSIAADGSDGLVVHVASQNEVGLTEFHIDISDLAQLDVRSDSGETIIGTAQNDIIWARDGADTVYAGAGDDRIIDGRGMDHLYGGGGADTFVMTPDGRRDYIHDFDVTQDMIDFSHVDHLHSIDQLRISARENGDWLVAFGTERIEVTLTSDAELTEDNFLFY